MSIKITNRKAIIYDNNGNFIGKRDVYRDPETANEYVFINGWCESIYHLTRHKGYTIAVETD